MPDSPLVYRTEDGYTLMFTGTETFGWKDHPNPDNVDMAFHGDERGPLDEHTREIIHGHFLSPDEATDWVSDREADFHVRRSVKDWSPTGRPAIPDPKDDKPLNNLIDDMANDDQSYFQGLGLMLQEWILEGRSREEIANNLNGHLSDIANIVDHIHKIMGTSRDD